MHTINQLTSAISSQNNPAQANMMNNSLKNSQSDTQTNSQCLVTKTVIASLFSGWKKIFKSKMKDEDWLADTVSIWFVASMI